MSKTCVNHEAGGKREELKSIQLKTTTANDTFQRLSYESRISFDALWEPRDAVSIRIKPQTRREYLGDPNLEHAIKTRPRVYMSPSINLDEVRNPDARKTLVNFTYTTTSSQASKEVWRDFKPRNLCLLYDSKEGPKERPAIRSIHHLPPGMEKVAYKWDAVQERNIIAEEILRPDTTVCYNPEAKVEITESREETKLRKLIDEKKLSMMYDKLPLSYGGFRSSVALGVPLEREELEFCHPNLPVSKALYQNHKYSSVRG